MFKMKYTQVEREGTVHLGSGLGYGGLQVLLQEFPFVATRMGRKKTRNRPSTDALGTLASN